MRKILSIIFVFDVICRVYAQWDIHSPAAAKYADSVYQQLSPKERIAQLLMIPVFANKNMKHIRQVSEYVKEYNIGGMILMQGTPSKFASYINYFQKLAKTPLLMSIDGEWGVSMRWDSTPVYPKQMTLGALSKNNDTLIYQMGLRIAYECRRLGIHINFAPVVDINNNPNNPVIGIRSFGEDKYDVSRKAWLYAKGLMDGGILPVMKHFPGHGDTDVDSHKDLPVINHTKERLDTLELYPFKMLIQQGVPAIMIAHLNIPALDTTKNRPSTLSKNIVTNLLKNELKFEGLIFTDAMNMKGVAKFFPAGVAEIEAIKAGNDVLLFSENVPKVITAIEKALNDSVLQWNQIEQACKKILKFKYLLNIEQNKFVKKRYWYEDIYKNKQAHLIINKISKNAVTLVQNKNDFLPIQNIKGKKFIHISVLDSTNNSFNQQLKNYIYPETHTLLDKNSDTSLLNKQLKTADIVFLQIIQKKLMNGKNNSALDSIIPLLENIAIQKPTILIINGTPYLLNKFSHPEYFHAIIYAYENKMDLSKATADVIFGSIVPKGISPVSTSSIPVHSQMSYSKNIRLPEIFPEEINISSDVLNKKIDSLINSAIQQKIFPGCQIVAVKDGKIFFRKSYGKMTYDDTSIAITNAHLYDIASVTKIASSALALMKLVSEKKLDVKKTLGHYLPELKHTNKENLVIEDILTHQSGLLPFIPFYNTALKYQKNDIKIFQSDSSEMFNIKVAENFWMSSAFKDSMWNELIKSPLKDAGKYVYSDLGYYFMQRIVEKITGKPLDKYVEENFYQPMNLGITYNPLKHYALRQIVPTEFDKTFRNQQIWGYVHDPGAAMMGGVAGHAGLFSNATDLATLMQMLLNNGNIFHQKFLDSAVIKEFTSCRFCPKNRRGLCFEKPASTKEIESPVPDCCSLESFGHFGFTGTMAWADPSENLVVVFLSNRVYPDATENKLSKSGIRGKLLKIFYNAVKHYYPYGIRE